MSTTQHQPCCDISDVLNTRRLLFQCSLIWRGEKVREGGRKEGEERRRRGRKERRQGRRGGREGRREKKERKEGASCCCLRLAGAKPEKSAKVRGCGRPAR